MPRDGKGLDPVQDVVTASEIAAFVYCEEQWRLQHGGFCPTPRKGSFQSRGCKSCRKRNAFRTYVLRRRNWRQSSTRPRVA